MILNWLGKKNYAICGGYLHIFIGVRWTAGVLDFNVLIYWNVLSKVF